MLEYIKRRQKQLEAKKRREAKLEAEKEAIRIAKIEEETRKKEEAMARPAARFGFVSGWVG